MPDQMNLSGTDFLAHERAGDLRSTASELHGVPKSSQGHAQGGRITRVRTAVGRRLISIGTAVAGHQL